MSDFLDEINKRLNKDVSNSVDEATEKVIMKDSDTTSISTVNMTSILNSFEPDNYASFDTCALTIAATTSSNMIITGDLTVEGRVTDNKQLEEFNKRFEAIEEKLLVLHNNVEKHEQYPTLKALYDQYKMIEALISGPETNECLEREEDDR